MAFIVKKLASYFMNIKDDDDDDDGLDLSAAEIVANIESYDFVPINAKEEKAILDFYGSPFSKITDSKTLVKEIGSSFKVSSENEPKTEVSVPTVKIQRFSGTITKMTSEFGMIDNKYLIDRQVTLNFANFEVGDCIDYHGEVTEFENNLYSRKVIKVFGKCSDMWDCENEEKVESEGKEEKRMIRLEPATVSGRDLRLMFFNEFEKPCHLDEVETNFIFETGDKVQVELVAEKDESESGVRTSFTVKEYLSLAPLTKKTANGTVTLCPKKEIEGRIDNTIRFRRDNCENGYVPKLQDQVTYEAIECDLGNLRYRAVSVIPSTKFCERIKKPSSLTFQSHKFGVSIEGETTLTSMSLHQTRKFSLKIHNYGSTSHLIEKLWMSSSSSQIRLTSPSLCNVQLDPDTEIPLELEANATNIGEFTQTLVVKLANLNNNEKYQVGLQIHMSVETENCPKRTPYKNKPTRYHVSADKMMPSSNRLHGEKLKRSSHFKRKGEQMFKYKIPEDVKQIYCGSLDIKKPKKEIMKELLMYEPELDNDLNANNYRKRFKMLLYLEEIDQQLNIRRYDMVRTFLKHKDEYLVLEVPGLTEQKPSLVLGDNVIVTQPWSNDKKEEYAGTIHKITRNYVHCKFHPTFHSSYDESECNVKFELNSSSFYRYHNALEKTYSRLGPDFLFPKTIIEKPCQVSFEEIENFDENLSKLVNIVYKDKNYSTDKNKKTELNDKGSVVKINVNWFNKQLNEYQKAAVLNIMAGRTRPYPYIIFGPPGTGKTVTLVETILQVLRKIESSRILVATPSNSAADLICQRLLETEHLVFGEMVRIASFNRVNDKLIPEFLKEYTVTVDICEDQNRKPNYISVGNHRLTVGTCGCIGSLYHLGLQRDNFTHIFVDESGQAMEPEIMVPLSFVNKSSSQVVLAGDPEQLGPVIISKIADDLGLEESFLQRITRTTPYSKDKFSFPNTFGYDPRYVTRLVYNYRSVPEILNLPNQMFYDGELLPTVSENEGIEADILKKLSDVFPKRRNRIGTPAIVFHGIRGQSLQENDCPSWYNPQEAVTAIIYVQKCYNIGLTEDDVGIVSPYKKQVQQIRNLLDKQNLPIPKIGSIEDFQGQERYVIIISAVRSTDDFSERNLSQNLGFIASPRRLNVALTRPRAALVILGNPHVLVCDPFWRNTLLYCIKNESFTGCDLPTLLDDEDNNDGDDDDDEI